MNLRKEAREYRNLAARYIQNGYRLFSSIFKNKIFKSQDLLAKFKKIEREFRNQRGFLLVSENHGLENLLRSTRMKLRNQLQSLHEMTAKFKTFKMSLNKFAV